MANRTKLTAKKRDEFLGYLSEGHTVSRAAALIGVRRQTVYEHRANDPDFKEAWEVAWVAGGEAMEEEALRRAVQGVEKPIYQGGNLAGYVQEYSDTLLIFLLKGRLPDKYKDRVTQEQAGEVTFRFVYDDRDADSPAEAARETS